MKKLSLKFTNRFFQNLSIKMIKIYKTNLFTLEISSINIVIGGKLSKLVRSNSPLHMVTMILGIRLKLKN